MKTYKIYKMKFFRFSLLTQTHDLQHDVEDFLLMKRSLRSFKNSTHQKWLK